MSATRRIGAGYTGLARVLDIGHHLILPALTLGLFFTALYARMMRASMLEMAGADYVRSGARQGRRRRARSRAATSPATPSCRS